MCTLFVRVLVHRYPIILQEVAACLVTSYSH